jgi:hypothetical protein
MARYLKNTEVPSGSTAIRLPYGSAASRPVSPVDAQVRFNETIQRYEGFYTNVDLTAGNTSGLDNRWLPFTVSTGSVSINREQLVIVNGQDEYRLANAPSGLIAGGQQNVLVFIGRILQYPTNYTITTDTASATNVNINIASASGANVSAGEEISVIYSIGSTV